MMRPLSSAGYKSNSSSGDRAQSQTRLTLACLWRTVQITQSVITGWSAAEALVHTPTRWSAPCSEKRALRNSCSRLRLTFWRTTGLTADDRTETCGLSSSLNSRAYHGCLFAAPQMPQKHLGVTQRELQRLQIKPFVAQTSDLNLNLCDISHSFCAYNFFLCVHISGHAVVYVNRIIISNGNVDLLTLLTWIYDLRASGPIN